MVVIAATELDELLLDELPIDELILDTLILDDITLETATSDELLPDEIATLLTDDKLLAGNDAALDDFFDPDDPPQPINATLDKKTIFRKKTRFLLDSNDMIPSAGKK